MSLPSHLQKDADKVPKSGPVVQEPTVASSGGGSPTAAGGCASSEDGSNKIPQRQLLIHFNDVCKTGNDQEQRWIARNHGAWQ